MWTGFWSEFLKFLEMKGFEKVVMRGDGCSVGCVGLERLKFDLGLKGFIFSRRDRRAGIDWMAVVRDDLV